MLDDLDFWTLLNLYLENSDTFLIGVLISGREIQINFRDNFISGSDSEFRTAFGTRQDFSRASLSPASVKGPWAVGEGSVVVDVLQGLYGAVGRLDGGWEDQRLFLVNGAMDWNL